LTGGKKITLEKRTVGSGFIEQLNTLDD